MKLIKKLLPFVVLAIVFGIAGYLVGVELFSNQEASLFKMNNTNPQSYTNCHNGNSETIQCECSPGGAWVTCPQSQPRRQCYREKCVAAIKAPNNTSNFPVSEKLESQTGTSPASGITKVK